MHGQPESDSGRPECLDSLVACVAEALPKALVPPKAARRLVEMAKGLPVFHAGAIECRLGPDGGGKGADLSVSAFRDAPALPAVIADDRLSSPGWLRVRRFLRDWLEPESPLAGRAGNIWLEFDAGSMGAPAPGTLKASKTLKRSGTL